jgi:putative transcriptional regulator
VTPIRLRRLRKRLGISQEALARLLGVSFATVNRWESDATTSEPRGVVLVLLQALEEGVQREPKLGERLTEWAVHGQPYVMQQVLALAYGRTEPSKPTRARR